MMRIPRRPLLGLGLFFVFGTGLGLRHPEEPALLLASTALTLALTLASTALREPFSGRLATAGILLTVLGTGWTNASLDRVAARSTPVESAAAVPATKADVIGIVTDEPLCVRRSASHSVWKFPVSVERLRPAAEQPWGDASGTIRVRLTLFPRDRVPAYGERWGLSGNLDRVLYKQGRMAGQSAGLFLATSGNRAHFLAEGNGNRFVRTCVAARIWAGRLLLRGIDDFPEQASILSSLLLGYYSQIPRDLYQSFAATGTLHVFAISGSHVVVFCLAVTVLLSACGITRTRWVLFLAPLLIGYTIMTGLQASAVRACIMALVFWSAPLLGRKADVYTALAASAILILAVVPTDLFDIGFVLSFVAVAGLVSFFPVFAEPLRRRFQPDPLRIQPETDWIRMSRRLWLFFADLLAMSLAAWLVSAPLTAWYFQQFSPIGLLGNLLAVPVASLIVITGFLSLLFGACLGPLADLFNHANLVLIYLLTGAIRGLAAVPGGCLQVGVLPVWCLPSIYALLATWRFAIWVGKPDPDTQ